jgi:hypothetical protein
LTDLINEISLLPALCRLIAEAACIIRHLEYDQWPEKHLVVVVQRV